MLPAARAHASGSPLTSELSLSLDTLRLSNGVWDQPFSALDLSTRCALDVPLS